MTAAHTLRLVLGDQLHPGHSWFSQVDEQVVYVLMEVRQSGQTSERRAANSNCSRIASGMT